MLHDFSTRSGCDTVKLSRQVVGSCPLALDHHRRKVPYIICAECVARPCGSLAVAIALTHMQNSYWQMFVSISGIKNNGVMGFLKRARFWYLAAFGTSYVATRLAARLAPQRTNSGLAVLLGHAPVPMTHTA